jgi:hypothetical protein
MEPYVHKEAKGTKERGRRRRSWERTFAWT